MIGFPAGKHAVVFHKLFLHREAIVEKLRKLPGCDQVRGLALRSG